MSIFDLFKYSGFAKKKDIASFEFLNGQNNGVVLGINPYSNKLLIDSSNENVLSLGQCRRGKTTGNIIPTALNWNKSLFCFDPKGEISKFTADYREKILGQNIYIFHPYTKDGTSVHWNPFSWIRSFDSFKDITILCSALIGIEDDEVAYYVFYPSNKLKKNRDYYLSVILTGLFLKFFHDRKNPTMTDLYCYVYENSFNEIINTLCDCPEAFRNLYDIYNMKCKEILKLPEEEKGVIFTYLQDVLAPFSPELCGDSLSKSDFTFSDLDENYCSLYIHISMVEAQKERIIVTMLLQIFLQRMYEDLVRWRSPAVAGKPSNTRILFLLDEFQTLPRLSRFFNLLLTSSHFGYSRFCIALQNIQALKNIYDDNFDAIFNLLNHRVFVGSDDKYTLDSFMKDLSEDIPNGRFNTEKLFNMDFDNVIIHFKGKTPIRAKKLLYFKNDYFMSLLSNDGNKKFGQKEK